MKCLLWPRTHMNLESLWSGQNLSCRCTAGKVGLICWKAPRAGFNGVELTGWLGPILTIVEPCDGIGLPCGTKFGLLGGRFGPGPLGLFGGRFGLSTLGLLRGSLGLKCCRL